MSSGDGASSHAVRRMARNGLRWPTNGNPGFSPVQGVIGLGAFFGVARYPVMVSFAAVKTTTS